MHITPAQLNAIQQKASTLIERHASALLSGEIIAELPMHQLWEWDQRMSGQYTQSLLKRFTLFKAVEPQIAETQQQYARDLKNQSGWIKEFREILKYYNSDVPHSPPPEFREAKPKAFASLLMPFVWYALKSFTDQKEFPGHLISRDTLISHCPSLLKLLSKVSASCFYSAFDDFRKTHGRDVTSKTQHTLYQLFETSMHADGIIRFFEEYSALARLLTTTTQQWILSTQVMIERLQCDLDAIAATFFKSRPPVSVKRMKCGLTAPHSIDGLVFEITFSHGGKVMYKPRSGKADLALAKMMSWINTSGGAEPLRSVLVLDGNKYSWHEYIGARACRTHHEVEQYYMRIGQLAALLHALGSTDYHFDNIRSREAHPYLTDNETLMSPYLKISDDHIFTGDEVLDTGIVQSPARSLFLLDTRKLFYPDPESISGVFNSTDRILITRYRNVNTDSIYPVKRYQTRMGNNIPRLGRHPVQPVHYVPSIKKGYTTTLRLIHAKQDDFHSMVESATEHFNMEVRMLVRPTNVYAQVLFESLRPEFLRDGVERSLLFEKLAPFFLRSYSPQECGKLLFEEIAMLENHLVPWFHTKVNDRTWQPSKSSHPIFKKSAQQTFEEMLKRMDKPFIDYQGAAIDHYLSHISGMATIAIPELLHQYPDKGAAKLFLTSCTIAQNLNFCYRQYYPIRQFMDIAEEGKISLIGRYTFSKGLLGVCITLAHFDPYLPDSCIDTIHSLLRPLLHEIQFSDSSDPAFHLGPGRIHELGSVIFGLSTLAAKLKDDLLLSCALRLAEMGFSSPPDESNEYSIGFGTAGYILGLTKLYAMKPNPTVRKVILDHTHDLLLKSTSDIHHQNGQRYGYFDGIAGVLHACCRAYEVTNDSGLLEKIEELYQRCQGLWIEEVAYYAHGRPGTSRFPNSQKTSLSEGMAGWLLVHMKAQQILYGKSPENEIVNASKQLLMVNARDVDHVSAGLAGICEPALLMGDPLESEHIQLIETWNRRYAKHRAFVLTPYFLNPFFNEGISGILYQQLRLLFRKEMPSLISFE